MMSSNKKALRVDLGKYYKPNPYKKDIITDPAGQWKYPGQPTRIPGNKITMQGVPYPVYGQDDQGNGQMMYPGQEYVFPGNYVDEYPQMQRGGQNKDYDMLGYALHHPIGAIKHWINPEKYHGTDKFKYPSHMTFSDESKYSTPEHQGGHWSQDEKGTWTFEPSEWNIQNAGGAENLQKWWNESEGQAGNILKLKKVGGIPELPLTAGRKAYRTWGYTNNDFIVNRQEGGNAQDISVPSLNSFAPGGINTPTDLSPENLNYYLTKLRFLENSVKKGYKNKKWYPYESIEGGADTIAYGHKILPGESFDKGITEAQAKRLQKKDALEKQRLAEYYVDKKYGKGTFDNLPQNHQMLLLDYQYNVSGGLNEFPNFTKALVESDKAKALSEYERENLGQRNQWTKDVLKNTYFPKQVDDTKPNLAEGGYKELELTPEEIEWYKANGYRIENID
jgi:hypothetical protein